MLKNMTRLLFLIVFLCGGYVQAFQSDEDIAANVAPASDDDEDLDEDDLIYEDDEEQMEDEDEESGGSD